MSYRRNELDLEHLRYVGLMFRWATVQYDLQKADIELMFYLYPLRFFTIKDFKEGTYHYCWDKNRWSRLNNDEWFKKIYKGNRRLGEHDKYALSKKAQLMVRRLGRILDGQEEFPMSVRNKLTGSDKYSHKVVLTSIKKKKENG